MNEMKMNKTVLCIGLLFGLAVVNASDDGGSSSEEIVNYSDDDVDAFTGMNELDADSAEASKIVERDDTPSRIESLQKMIVDLQDSMDSLTDSYETKLHELEGQKSALRATVERLQQVNEQNSEYHKALLQDNLRDAEKSFETIKGNLERRVEELTGIVCEKDGLISELRQNCEELEQLLQEERRKKDMDAKTQDLMRQVRILNMEISNLKRRLAEYESMGDE